MGVVLAGAAIAAVGAGVSAYGTAQNASAVADAAEYAALLENNLAKKQQAKLDTLISDKTESLKGINTILDRYDGGAAFGSSDVLDNIRKAQSDFSALAAGDFGAFQSQLDSILKATLSNTYGSGAAEGTYTQLAADTVMNLRGQGLQSALGAGEFLSNESYKTLGSEFGIMDQAFEQQYMIERNRVSGITGNQMIAAQQTGVGTAAAGQAITQVGGLVSSVGAFQQNSQMANRQMSLAEGQLANSTRYYDSIIGGARPTVSNQSVTAYSGYTPPSSGGSSGGSTDGYFDLPTSQVNPGLSLYQAAWGAPSSSPTNNNIPYWTPAGQDGGLSTLSGDDYLGSVLPPLP